MFWLSACQKSLWSQLRSLSLPLYSSSEKNFSFLGGGGSEDDFVPVLSRQTTTKRPFLAFKHFPQIFVLNCLPWKNLISDAWETCLAKTPKRCDRRFLFPSVAEHHQTKPAATDSRTHWSRRFEAQQTGNDNFQCSTVISTTDSFSDGGGTKMKDNQQVAPGIQSFTSCKGKLRTWFVRPQFRPLRRQVFLLLLWPLKGN